MSIFKNDLVSATKNIEINGNKITINVLYSKKNQIPFGILQLHGGFGFPSDVTESSDLVAYAKAGFLCVQIQYPNDGSKAISLLADVQEAKDASLWMRQRWPGMKGLFLVGVSRGGFVAYHAITVPFPFDKVVICCAPTDLTLLRKTTAMPKATLDRLWPYLNWANSEIVSSPIYYTKTIGAGPLYMAYGVKDTIIPIEQGRRMWKAMQPSNPKSVYKEFNEGHGLANNEKVSKEIMSWLIKP